MADTPKFKRPSRRTVVVTAIVLLGGFGWWLFGGATAPPAGDMPAATTAPAGNAIVPYDPDGENTLDHTIEGETK